MTPREGINQFLGGLIAKGLLRQDELERVIAIAGKNSPSGSFTKVIQDWQLLQSMQANLEAYWSRTRDRRVSWPSVRIALQKGARWLAMLRRDEGQKAFEAQCQELRAIVGKSEAKSLAVNYRHIERHFVGSGELGASIDRWSNTEEMLADPGIQAELEQTLRQLDPDSWEAQNIIIALPFEVGFEGKVRLDDLPHGAKVWQEIRGDYVVNVTDAIPPRTRHLTFVFGQKPDVWLLITVFSGSTPSRPLSDEEWWQDWAFYELR